ncbi:MAG: ferritin-like domain-containing protein [Taibaiella sp.]|nr:ferritin-like domain-containing protein [Taibaiella sp.]
MNFRNILQEIQQADPEVFEKLSGRRHILKNFGSKVALAALPLAIGSMFKKAYGKSTISSVADVLNFALELEYFEYNYYHTAMATGSNTTTYLVPPADRAGFQMVEDHEKAHVNFLRTAIDAMGLVPFTPNNYVGNPVTGNPFTPPSYDFTARNTFRVFDNYAGFLELAQTFEDTGVRAYQGQLPDLLGNTDGVLTQVLQISTVEARHAAYIRLVRRLGLGAIDNPKPWITNNIPPIISLQPNYLGEDNTVQKGVEVTSIAGYNGNIPKTAATEAFDEPLDKATVASLIAPFKR